MTVLRAKCPRGFSIVELLIVIAIISFIAALLLPALSGAKNRGKSADCVNRLKQIGMGYRLWASDNEGFFPWNLEVAKGGSAGSPDWTDNFRTVSNELVTPKILACPSDQQKKAHDQWHSLDGNRHISYFLGFDAHESRPQTILSGDASLSGGGGGTDQLTWNTAVGSSIDADWLSGFRHGRQGHIVLADGGVHQVSTAQLREQISAALASGSAEVIFSLPQGVY